jgi:hypothetical protein
VFPCPVVADLAAHLNGRHFCYGVLSHDAFESAFGVRRITRLKEKACRDIPAGLKHAVDLIDP